jgi:hypothetical protein
VNLTTDEHDAKTTDGICDIDASSPGLQCTLRAAVEQANFLSSADLITFNSLLSNSAITLTTTSGGEIPITNNGSLTINGLGANLLTINGGAGTNRIFYVNQADVTINGVTLTGGNGTGSYFSGATGGAILTYSGRLVLDSVHVTANSVTGDPNSNSVGGVYFNGGSNHQILNSTFSANTSSGSCAGFLSQTGITVINSTFSNNTTQESGGGFCLNGGSSTLRSVTVTANSAKSGGGIVIFDGSVNLGNTIIAGNTGGAEPDIFRNVGKTITTVGYNLIGNHTSVETAFPTGNPNVNNDIVGSSISPINPLLKTLDDNGGSNRIPTHDLLQSSPAFDKGNSFSLSFDQRGLVRPVDNPNTANAAGGDGADIGAFEQQSSSSSIGALQYYPLAYPIRLLDTRSGQPACYAPGVGFTGYETIKTQPAQVVCQGLTIPATAQAIVGTATALNTPQGGNLRLYPAGEQLAEVSNVNFVPGRTVSNSFTVKLGTGGAFNIYSYSPSDVIIDVTGYYAAPGTGGLYYHQLPNPIRILETRPGEAGYQTPGAPLAANSVRLQQAGNITYLGVTIPASARAITGNATVVNNGFSNGGALRLYPGDINQVVVTENINYVAGQTIPNAFTARLDSNGRFNIYTSATTHVLIDVTGYYSTEPAADQNGREGLLFNILPRPFRLLDTRAGYTACDAPGVKLSAQTVRVQTVRGRTCSNQTVPSTAKAIFGNATVVNNFAGASFGNIRLYPGEQPLANASNLNYVQGDVMPNSFIVGLGTTNGAMNIWSYSSTDFIVDVSGYFAAPPAP